MSGIEIKVRYSSGAYLARAGTGKAAKQASCTVGAYEAAWAVARKCLSAPVSSIVVVPQDGDENRFLARRLGPDEVVTVIEFEDHGQDFLEWDVLSDGTILDSRPFQASTWCCCRALNAGSLFPGGPVRIRTPRGEELTINYPIAKLRRKGGAA